MGRASKLKQQRRVQPQEGSHHTVANAKYLLFEPKSSNYLASLEALGGMERLDWCPHLGGATKFPSLGQAKAQAKRIVKNRGYSLQVMELIETEGQLSAELITEVLP
jgi:hypothetical protein